MKGGGGGGGGGIAVCIANITDLMIHFYSFSDLCLCTVDPILPSHTLAHSSYGVCTCRKAPSIPPDYYYIINIVTMSELN